LTVWVVRHGQAGTRKDFDGDDRDRPLTARGQWQSDAIADRLATEPIERLVSSPYRRCVQTLVPLGERLGLPVDEDERLAEDTPTDDTIALLEELGDGAVLCSHGDVVTGTITTLERRGMTLLGPPDWRKGTVWVIERHADGARTAAVVSPPDRDPLDATE
jgi:8-oxo-dGTP diphosphatase